MQSLNYGLRIGMPKGQQIDEIVPDLVTQSGKSFRKLKSKVEKPEIKRIKQSQFDLKIKFYEFSQQALNSYKIINTQPKSLNIGLWGLSETKKVGIESYLFRPQL